MTFSRKISSDAGETCYHHAVTRIGGPATAVHRPILGTRTGSADDAATLMADGPKAAGKERHGMKTLRTLLLAGATAGLTALAGTAAQAQDTIVDTAVAAGNFETLVAALEAAGMADQLRSVDPYGPYTVFAPTDEAFAALGQNTIDTLLRPENIEQLREILKYHIVPGSVPASALVNSQGVAMTQAIEFLPYTGLVGGVQVGDTRASVVQADIQASNGVIHVIDEVLMP